MCDSQTQSHQSPISKLLTIKRDEQGNYWKSNPTSNIIVHNAAMCDSHTQSHQFGSEQRKTTNQVQFTRTSFPICTSYATGHGASK